MSRSNGISPSGTGRHAAKSLYDAPHSSDQKVKAAPDPDYFVLEYSPSQKAFHIEPLHEMIAANSKSFMRGRLNDYSPIAMHKSREQLEQAVKHLKQRGENG